MRPFKLSLLPLVALAVSAYGQSASMTLSVDLRDAPQKMIHAVETLQVKPGAMTLLYPEWIPGEHMPDGPVDDQAGFVITTPTGQRVTWVRDSVNMFAYHLTVPANTTQLDIKMDFLATAAATGFSSGASTSANLAMLSWNEVLVYPEGVKPADVEVTPSITLPVGWKFGTALEPTSPSGAEVVTFKPVPLEELVDSPVLTGRYFREIPLATEVTPKHYLDLAGDGPEDVQLSQEHIDQFSKLVRETGALYKSRHYHSYHFLVTLSDQVAHFGLEHHQSSDDRVQEKTFVDDNMFIANGLLLPHEFTHSWNGKYRRPAGLATGNYSSPMKGNLLWVYEGLTEYLGDVLAARCGIWNSPIYIARMATILGYQNDLRPGRTWRNLQDTATAAQVLYAYSQNEAYDNWRRNTDYYDEGELLWLEVDLTIRAKTHDKKSLNDFAAAFEGVGGNTGPIVLPYTFEDVVKALNAVVPNDWADFFRKRLDSNERNAPELAGIDALSGYKLVYTSTPNYWTQLLESEAGAVNTMYSLGMDIGPDGTISDVLVGGIAQKDGFGPGMKVIAVNGREYAPLYLRADIQAAAGNGPALEFIVANGGYYKVIRVDYHGGEKYPDLVREAGVPDRLTAITTPMTN